jgi:predicted ATPase
LVLQNEGWPLSSEEAYSHESINANIPPDFNFEKIREESNLKNIRHHDVREFFIPNWRVYHFHDTSERAKVKQKHASNDNLRLKPDAANLAAYLRMLRQEHAEAYQRIVGTIRLVAPFFDDFVHRKGEPEFIELEWLQKGNPDTPFKAHMLSDGTLRFICLATLLLQPIELLPHTVLIDEPELGLHPYAIAMLADMFKQVAEERQLIVSTQSVELINELAPEDVVVVDQEDGASTFRRFTQDELADWLKEYSLGELWKRNVLGGRP